MMEDQEVEVDDYLTPEEEGIVNDCVTHLLPDLMLGKEITLSSSLIDTPEGKRVVMVWVTMYDPDAIEEDADVPSFGAAA